MRRKEGDEERKAIERERGGGILNVDVVFSSFFGTINP